MQIQAPNGLSIATERKNCQTNKTHRSEKHILDPQIWESRSAEKWETKEITTIAHISVITRRLSRRVTSQWLSAMTARTSSSKRTAVDDPLVKWSKRLSGALRHNAMSMGLHMTPDGSVDVQELLAHSQFRGLSWEVLQTIVADNSKKRFELLEGPSPRIRAAQGHSLTLVDDEALLHRLVDEDDLFQRTGSRQVIHGTRRKYMSSILIEGLMSMKRNHMHFAISLPTGGAISGMRISSEVAIVVDMAAAQADGIVFFLSSNMVVLTKGVDDSGVLPARYFKEIVALDGKPAVFV